jgi:hypothetical protein
MKIHDAPYFIYLHLLYILKKIKGGYFSFMTKRFHITDVEQTDIDNFDLAVAQ